MCCATRDPMQIDGSEFFQCIPRFHQVSPGFTVVCEASVYLHYAEAEISRVGISLVTASFPGGHEAIGIPNGS